MEEQITRQKLEFDEQLKQLTSSHTNEISKMNRKYRHSLQSHEIDLENVRKNYEKEMNRLNESIKELSFKLKSEQQKDQLIESLHQQLSQKLQDIEKFKAHYDIIIDTMTQEHDQEIHDLTIKFNDMEKTLNKKIKSQESKIKDVKQRLEASRHESDMLKLQVEKEKKQRHQNNTTAPHDMSNSKPKETTTTAIATAPTTGTTTTTTNDTSSAGNENKPLRSVHRRQNSSFTIERNEKGNSSVIVVERTAGDDYFNENYEYDEYTTSDVKSLDDVKNQNNSQWRDDDEEKDRSARDNHSEDELMETEPEEKGNIGNGKVEELDRKYQDTIETLRSRNQSLEKELANHQKQTEKDIKKLNEKIQELKRENDRTSEEFVSDKQRLLYAMNQKETTIKKQEAEMEKNETKLFESSRSKKPTN